MQVMRLNFEISLCPYFYNYFLRFWEVHGHATPQMLSENLQGVFLPLAPRGKLCTYTTKNELFSKPLLCTPPRRSSTLWPLPNWWCQRSVMLQLSENNPFSTQNVLFPLACFPLDWASCSCPSETGHQLLSSHLYPCSQIVLFILSHKSHHKVALVHIFW